MTNPKALKTGDRVRIARGSRTSASEGVIAGEPTSFGNYPVEIAQKPTSTIWLYESSLTLIEEPTPEPAPAVTDEQRAAVEWLQAEAAEGSPPANWHAAALLAALPSELTNPQPVLPTEPGWYVGRDDTTWRLTDGVLRCLVVPHREPTDFAPFTRLVPERPQITREQVVEAVDAGFRAGMPGSVEFSDALHAALVNGADQ